MTVPATQTAHPAPPAPPATPPPTASVWEDFVDIFYAPSAVFERRRIGQFGLALVILIVLSALLVAGFWNALQPMFEATVDMTLRQAAAKGQPMPPEAMSAARRFGSMFAGVMAVVGVPLAVLFGAFVVWLFGKLLDAPLGFAQAMTVMTFANIPRVLGWVVIGVQGLLGDATKPIFSYMLAPTRFLDPDTTSTLTMAIWSRFDLFTLWATVLIGIGVAVIARVPRARGFAVAALVWVVAGAFSLLQALTG